MRNISLNVLYALAAFPFCASGQEWKTECVGYYQLQLPDNLEVALYPVKDFTHPRKQPESSNGIQYKRYAIPGITFEKTYYGNDTGTVQAQFSGMYYDDYEIEVSSESDVPVDFTAYQARIKDNKEFRINVVRQREQYALKILDKAVTPKADFDRIYGYLMKDYPDAFSLYVRRTYTLYINKDNRLFHFWKKYQKDTGDKSQTAEKQWRDSEPEVLSLLSRFRPRKLYEVPQEQGFCMPYGFIAGDSGHEPRNMAVTYRLKTHPDVTIFFQDLGTNPGPGQRRPDPKMNAKDYVTYFWNVRYGHSFREIKLYGKGFSSPEMDKRKAVAAFAKFTRFSKETDYGYVAYVKGDENNNTPGLFFYVMRDSRQAKDQPPLDKDELEKMAEHIVRSVKRR